jgi:hypothetical protein
MKTANTFSKETFDTNDDHKSFPKPPKKEKKTKKTTTKNEPKKGCGRPSAIMQHKGMDVYPTSAKISAMGFPYRVRCLAVSSQDMARKAVDIFIDTDKHIADQALANHIKFMVIE